jgi:histidinol-phosphate phosphatase family protein
MKRKQPRGAVFLDRDGVINVDRRDYVKSWSEFRFMPRVFEALRLLKKNNLRVVIITNQSAVHRGLMSIETLEEIHHRMLKAIERRGGHIEAVYFCPHTPSENCECRKPKPGMVLQATKDLGIDLERSYFVGDSQKDIELARSLGMKCARVTGSRPHGIHSERGAWMKSVPISVGTLLEGVAHILDDLRSSPR